MVARRIYSLESPSETQPRYALIRQINKRGHHPGSHIYRLEKKAEGEHGVTRTYRRVSDGALLNDDDKAEEIVTTKKSVLPDKLQSTKPTWRERQKQKALSLEQWATVIVRCVLTSPTFAPCELIGN